MPLCDNYNYTCTSDLSTHHTPLDLSELYARVIWKLFYFITGGRNLLLAFTMQVLELKMIGVSERAPICCRVIQK